MGLFSRRPGPVRIDWSTVEIGPHPQWARHAEPFPDTVAVVDDAVGMSGVPSEEVDRVACVVGVWNIIVGQGQAYLESSPAAAAGLEEVRRRPDLTDSMLWDYFTHHDAAGVAARNLLVDQFNSGQITEVLAQLIAQGGMRLELGGKDRL